MSNLSTGILDSPGAPLVAAHQGKEHPINPVLLDTTIDAAPGSENHYRALFDLSPVAVYSIDAAGVIQKFNQRAAELWGRVPKPGDTDERFCGSHKLFRPDGTYMPHAQCPMAQVASGELSEVSDGEVLIERPDGSRITVLVNIRPLKDPNGKVAGAINCFYDITQRTHIQEQRTRVLADLNRRKDEFLAILGHELRNPLASIGNAVHLLRRQTTGDPSMEHARAVIERQVNQLTRLVDDLRDASSIATGKVQLHLSRVCVSEIVDRAVESVGLLLEQRGHQLDVSLPSTPIWLLADPGRLEQALVNLLINAAKYTHEAGRIFVKAGHLGEQCVISVRDTGVGIAPHLLPRIFDLFTQSERSLSQSQGGLGIGLALVKGVVEMHEGRVEVRSSVGQGTEFLVTLPALAR